MNSLPTDDNTIPTPAPSSGVAKELEPSVSSVEVNGLQEVGKDVDLPKEVAATGVRISPTTVQVPPPVAQLGVQPVAAPPAVAPVTVVLPLSDEQIAQGLHQGLASSWRWVAEWCVRRLKQAHLALRSVHGKTTRVSQ